MLVWYLSNQTHHEHRQHQHILILSQILRIYKIPVLYPFLELHLENELHILHILKVGLRFS